MTSSPLQCPFCGLLKEKPQDEDTAIALLAFHIDVIHYGDKTRPRFCYWMARTIIEKANPAAE